MIRSGKRWAEREQQVPVALPCLMFHAESCSYTIFPPQCMRTEVVTRRNELPGKAFELSGRVVFVYGENFQLTRRLSLPRSPGGPGSPFCPWVPMGPIWPGSPGRPLSPWTPLSPGIPGSPCSIKKKVAAQIYLTCVWCWGTKHVNVLQLPLLARKSCISVTIIFRSRCNFTYCAQWPISPNVSS